MLGATLAVLGADGAPAERGVTGELCVRRSAGELPTGARGTRASRWPLGGLRLAIRN